MDSLTALRLRAILDSNAWIVILALVVLIGLGGVGVWNGYLASTTTLQEGEEPIGDVTAGFEHSATVENGSIVHEDGEVLRNQPRYFNALTPEANVSFGVEYTGDMPVTVNLTLVQTLQTEVDDTPLITQSQELYTESTRLDNPSQVTESVMVEPGAIIIRFAEIEEAVQGDVGDQRAWIRAHVEIDGPDTVEEEVDLMIDARNEYYSFEESDTIHHEFTETTRVAVEEEPGLLQRVGGPLGILLGITGIAVLAVARYKGMISLSEAEREYLTYRDDLAEYDEYIVQIEREEERPLDGDHLQSLSKLVTLAKARGSIVLEEASSGRCFVEDDGQRYVFVPPPAV